MIDMLHDIITNVEKLMGCLNRRGSSSKLLVFLCVLIFAFLFFVNKKITDDINEVSTIPSPVFETHQSLAVSKPASLDQADSDSAPTQTDILGNTVKETKKLRMKEPKGLDIVYEPKPGHKDIYLPN